MISKLDVEYIFEDNDASASEFGWDFQENAGIFLFLHYIKEAQSVAVESKNQDIEIKFQDKTIYAQAKALQDSTQIGTENAKLRDAMASLAKVNIIDGDLLFYISNLSAPIDGEKDLYRNDIVSFSNCPLEQQQFIKKQVEVVVNRLKNENEKQTTKAGTKKKNIELISRLENFNYDNLYISSIYPFGITEDRYRKIKDKVIEIMTGPMGIDSIEAKGYSDKILKHWQSVLHFDATIPDNKNYRKFIKKEDFVWTVLAVVCEKVEADFIAETLSSCIDDSFEEECNCYLENEENLYHERFEFMNQVLHDYEDFKKTLAPGSEKADRLFIKSDKWKKYVYEFEDVSDESMREYIIKCYLYKIINRNKRLVKITKGVGLCSSRN